MNLYISNIELPYLKRKYKPLEVHNLWSTTELGGQMKSKFEKEGI